MDLNKTLTYILLFFCLQISGQGLLIKWDSPSGFGDVKYGYLYNWYVTDSIANTSNGWRVPSDADWDTLVAYLGGDSVAGGKLKETGFEYWDSPNTGATNEVGFNARGGGLCSSSGAFSNAGVRGRWWSSTENGGTGGRNRRMYYDSTNALSSEVNKLNGFSIRVIRDSTSTETGMADGTLIPNAYTGNDGKKYHGVKIGSQVWINQNLIETKYNDGTDIDEVTLAGDWTALTTGARCSYDNDENNAIFSDGKLIKWDEPRYRAVDSVDIKYGYLYNFYVTDSIAATGWRVPSDADWDTLIAHLGGDAVAGGKLKETGLEYWGSPNTGAINEVGFNARGGGLRSNLDGSFGNAVTNGFWWSATENDATIAWYRRMFSSASDVFRFGGQKTFGFPLRTLRDSTSTESGMSDGTLIPNAYTGNDGKKYDGVVIGTQVWINANLAETKYNNGEPILEVTDNTAWSNLTTGARCSYDNDEANALEVREEAGLYAESRPDLIKFDFDVPAHSRLLFPSDTTHMAGSFVNDTFRISKWYDYIKRDSLVQATAALRPWFDFADGSVRFDGGQELNSLTAKAFLSEWDGDFSVALNLREEIYLPSAAIVWLFHSSSTGTPKNTIAYYQRLGQIGFDANEFLLAGGDRTTLGESSDGLEKTVIINSTKSLYVNNKEINTAIATGPLIIAQGLFIGGVNGARHVTGNIRTIILFDFPLNKAQRILTNKYLQK